MKRVKYTLEKAAQGWILKSETGEETSNFFSKPSGYKILMSLSSTIDPASAVTILKELKSNSEIALTDDDSELFKSFEFLAGIDITINYFNLVEKAINAEMPDLIMCDCGKHGKIVLNAEEWTCNIWSKPFANKIVSVLQQMDKIDEAGKQKLLRRIEESELSEDYDYFSEDISIVKIFPGSFSIQIAFVRDNSLSN